MEIIIPLISLFGSFLTLAAAFVSRRMEIVHRIAIDNSGRKSSPIPRNRGEPHWVVFQSTLFGLAIGLFFGTVILCGFLISDSESDRRYRQWVKNYNANPDRFNPPVRPNKNYGFGIFWLVIFGCGGAVAGLAVGFQLTQLGASLNKPKKDTPGETGGHQAKPAAPLPDDLRKTI